MCLTSVSAELAYFYTNILSHWLRTAEGRAHSIPGASDLLEGPDQIGSSSKREVLIREMQVPQWEGWCAEQCKGEGYGWDTTCYPCYVFRTSGSLCIKRHDLLMGRNPQFEEQCSKRLFPNEWSLEPMSWWSRK